MTGYLRNLIASSSLVLGCFSFALPATAQGVSVTITFDENGNGTLTSTAGFNGTLPHQVGLDPGPGGHSTLEYDLLNPIGLTAGDVVLLDGRVTSDVTVISDVIRFNTSSFTGGTGSVAFYSRDSDGGLADTFLPSSFYTNLVNVTEGSGPFLLTYTPTAGQPGFVAGFTVTYDIAENLAVPGPIIGAGLPGLILACGGLLVLSWRRRKRKAEAAA